MIELERQGPVAVLRMVHGKANAMDLELCDALAARIDECQDSSIGSVLITGQGSIFSAGVDLLRVVEGGAEYVRRFLPALSGALEAVFACEKPIVAAVNGHAIAGGCILACAADHRIMARGSGRIGIPELRVGVPFPVVPVEIMRFAAPIGRLQTWIFQGVTLDADAAASQGLVDVAADAERLPADALAAAERMAALPGTAFALTKRQLREPTLQRIRAAAARDAEVLAAWQAPATLDAIREYVARTLRK